MTELKEMTDYVDDHIFIAAHMNGYLWGVSENAVIGIAVDHHFPFVVNNIYLKNALKDDDDNFCELDIYEYKRGNLTPKHMHLEDYDDTEVIEEFIKNNANDINVKHFELVKTNPEEENRQLKLRDFFGIITETEKTLAQSS